MSQCDYPIGQRVLLPGHFPEPVTLEAVRSLGTGYECRVRLPDGTPDEAILSEAELAAITGHAPAQPHLIPADAEKIRLFVESSRIRLAYAHDRQFAVSLSGIRTLPHQVEAVYLKMLPQPRLRFLLADDPGAGKTIMAGLLIKEMKLREAIERVLILCPAPLTIQWQDELQRWFGEDFDIIFSAVDQQQLTNPWQRNSQVIASMDYAKQEDVRERIWQQRWDLVVIDEAHKCSAYTKRSTSRGDEVEKTRRYQLAEKLSERTDHLLLLTATPHHGDDDRFAHFIRLVDPDVFPEPHRLGDQAKAIRRQILQLGPDCPWSLRRLKEDLRDMEGRRLFPDRFAHTITFQLNAKEYHLYRAVTAYINEFLPQGTGRRKASVALVRTVLQRRLASSTHAIFESLKRRHDRQKALLEELEVLPPAQRARRLAELQGRRFDVELDEDDLDDAARDELVDAAVGSVDLDQLRLEIAALQDLVQQARTVRDSAADSKLAALRECLARAEFQELKDGRGKLLIFTEHRDTLNYLREHLERWGYTTVQIHGSMNPRERKAAQGEFHTGSQVCVATEAAGEGINLQFCHLMINYDLPWNPTRLEQRLGRIHRIGQQHACHAFNFVANDSQEGQPVIEGRIMERLLEKMEQMRAVLADRVFDVIGEILALNDINLPEMLREAAHDPRRLDEYLTQIQQIDPNRLRLYEEATGIALARANVDFSAFQQANVEAEERRLMPRYVDDFFRRAAAEIGLRVETRADGLYRIEHVLAGLRSERLAAVRRAGGPPASEYRKLTFDKSVTEQDAHLDAVLLGPGHILYATVDEVLNERLTPLLGHAALYADGQTEVPYWLHFFEMSVRGTSTRNQPQTIYGELVAVREEIGSGLPAAARFSVVPADILVDLPAFPGAAPLIAPADPAAAADFLKGTYQMERRTTCQDERRHFGQVCRDYLQRSFDARTFAAQNRVMALKAREVTEPEVAIARQRAEHDLADLARLREERLAGLARLEIARHGPIRHVASALVLPPDAGGAALAALAEDLSPELRRRAELAAEDVVIAYEVARGWSCERVGHLKIGFDIRSMGPADPQTGYRDPTRDIRRIEVKGRIAGQPIRLTTNEWYKAAQLGDSYWLYVVWGPLSNPDPTPLMIRNPVQHLDHAKREVVAARYFDLPAAAILEAARRQSETTP